MTTSVPSPSYYLVLPRGTLYAHTPGSKQPLSCGNPRNMIKSSNKLSLLNEINKRKEAASSKPNGSSASRGKGKTADNIKQNAGLLKRLAKDEMAYAALSENDATSGHQRQTILMAKAKLYEKLRKGDSAGLTDAQRASLSVDFDAKSNREWDDMVSDRKGKAKDSENRSASESSGEDSSDDDSNGIGPLVEVMDEFGRVRMLPKSQADKIQAKSVPPLPTEIPESALPDLANAIYGDQQQFPVYEPTPEEQQKRYREQAERTADVPLFQHYDANAEIRARGAAQYTFSKDEETRKEQMEAIKNQKYEVDMEKRRALEAKQDEAAALDDRKQLLAEKKRKLLAARQQKQQTSAQISTQSTGVPSTTPLKHPASDSSDEERPSKFAKTL